MNVEKEPAVFIGLLFLLLPYLMTAVLLGRDACPVSREVSVEEYVAAVTASQISWGYSKEAVKAQTVIARTNLYLKKAEGKEAELIRKAADSIKSREMDSSMLRRFRIFQEAADETKGQVLKRNRRLAELPYHALSRGRTRDGKEVLGDEFSYIPSVETPEDIDSPLYAEDCYFSSEELERKLKGRYSGFALGEACRVEIKSEDAAGYVMEIQVGNQAFQGEQIRELLGLPSACFTVEKAENQVKFSCKGVGHGMGMSQYTAQKMALEGRRYEEILEYFFPETELGEY